MALSNQTDIKLFMVGSPHAQSILPAGNGLGLPTVQESLPSPFLLSSKQDQETIFGTLAGERDREDRIAAGKWSARKTVDISPWVRYGG